MVKNRIIKVKTHTRVVGKKKKPVKKKPVKKKSVKRRNIKKQPVVI